ncbi:CBF-domain-containing protein [Annulohypoxylon maeteangense]|uniref:CBF-domain-containing protein n=1 Tax=Annulohypoxylon maeteangense TaxID=1927788 RepID=UPI002007513C|nr:CBF-domain-containing protein [Annulohypoxylon maeteangense]KAI0889475.1 CBF-domain-containing protein [Annulohypoxylon maeteangense]
MASFDDAALSQLTAKIENKLTDSKQPQSKKGQGKRKLDETIDPVQPPPNKKKSTSDLNGRRNDKKSKKTQKPVVASKKVESSSLLDEIKALGGDEEDLKLVEDANSDDEELYNGKGQKNKDKGLQAELAKFAAGLGFDDVRPESESEGADEDMNEADGASDDEGEDDDASVIKSDEKSIRDPKRKTKFEPRSDWHAVSLRTLPTPSSDDITPYAAAIAELKAYAKSTLDEDSVAYSKTLSASSSHRFMSTIMSSGTMSDKVSALTLAIQESPIHNIKALENLIGLSAKRSRGQALAALAALVDLFGPGMILPSDRRLRLFSSQLGLVGTLQKYNVKTWSAGQKLPGKITKEHLISWIFEDWLKESYFRMIQNLEVWCDDEVEYARTKAVDLAYALLRDKPEQESNLLRLLVNKLGDRERKISSRASYLILQLLNSHPGMKQVVIRSIEQDIIFRPGQHIRAKYYAINTLNQTILSTKEPQIADSLLNIYFGLFVSLLKSGELSQLDNNPDAPKGGKRHYQKSKPVKKPEDKAQAASGDREAAEKLVSAILTGVNRAVPFSQAEQSTLESHLDTLFRITHSSNFNTSIQALMLIQQLAANRHLATDRFYRTLYESLLDPRLITSSKQALYLNLLYRSLKADVDVRRVKAFVKRMLQVLNLHQPSFVCGIMYLIIDLCVTFPDIKTLINEPEEYDDDEVIPGVASDAPAETLTGGAEAQPTKADSVYDGRKRNPEYSNAHRSCLWELLPFLKHYHPSVDVFASALISGRKAAQKPELANHTLIAFLDKFVYRNAKAVDSTKGVSIMQPVAASGQGSVLLSSKPSAKAAGSSLNSAEFWNKKSEDVAVEDVFFHEYFSRVGKSEQAQRKKAKKDKAAEGEDAEEAAEDEIWDALVASRPEVEGESDDEADFDDLMSLDDDQDLEKEMAELDDGSEDEEEGGVEFWDDSDDDDDEGDSELQKAPVDEGEEEKEKKPESERTKRRKAIKSLPMFASADDYAEMLAQDEDDL